MIFIFLGATKTGQAEIICLMAGLVEHCWLEEYIP